MTSKHWFCCHFPRAIFRAYISAFQQLVLITLHLITRWKLYFYHKRTSWYMFFTDFEPKLLRQNRVFLYIKCCENRLSISTERVLCCFVNWKKLLNIKLLFQQDMLNVNVKGSELVIVLLKDHYLNVTQLGQYKKAKT